MSLAGATIAIAVTRTGEFYVKPVLRGAAHALQRAGSRIVVLTGEEWSATPLPRNEIYDLLDSRSFDGALVLGGTLFHEQGAAVSFGERFARFPMVSVGTVLPGASCVLADNSTGVKSAVLHLAGLGRRRIAFIRGPSGNTDAAERYKGYREGLKAAGLPFASDLVAPGAFVELSGKKAVKLWLDERGATPDAIVAGNDESARGAMEALQRRGLVVPDDIAVIGFDNTADTELCSPKLTTVAQPLVEQGLEAVALLEALLAGEKPGRRVTLDAQLVCRDSCGGRESAASRPSIGVLRENQSAADWATENFEAAWPWLFRRTGWTRLDEPAVRQVVIALLDLNLRHDGSHGWQSIESGILQAPDDEIWRWFRGLLGLRDLLVDVVEPSRRADLEDVIAKASRFAAEANILAQVRARHRDELTRRFTFAFFGDLFNSPNRAAMLDSFRLNARTHPRLSSCYVTLREQDSPWSRLAMSSSPLVEEGTRFPSRTVLPQQLFANREAFNLCVAPLSSERETHGTLVVEAPLEDTIFFAYVADQVGAWLSAASRGSEPSGETASGAESLPERIGEYPVKQRIGVGGMATVYLAEARVAGVPRPVAIKLMHPHLQDRMWSEQFVEEARVTAAIRHPNVVPLLELGRHDGNPFLVMEYVDGQNLGTLLAHQLQVGDPLPAHIGGRIVVDALAGLHAAHELCDLEGFPVNLVHRDVSPQNILVGRDGVTRITDFGIARGSDEGRTKTGVVKGKLRYMAPEQAGSSTLDRRTDVWAMGVVAWEVLVGRRMYGEMSEKEVLGCVLSGNLPLLGDSQWLPRQLVQVVEVALQCEPEARYSSALEFRAALVKAFRANGGLADSEEVAEAVRGRNCPTVPLPAAWARV